MRRFILLLATVMFITYCQSLPLLDDKQVNQMGVDTFQKIKAETPIEKDPKINQYVQCVANHILSVAVDPTGVKEWEVVVFRSDMVNAFALPGGKIGVYTGILKVAKTQDQLAAVIGHEVGHVIKRHGKQRIESHMIAAGSLKILEGTVVNNPAILGALGVGVQYGIILPFSRTQESEADTVGLELMAKAGFHPRGAIELWQNMKELSGPKVPEFLSTHPAPETRIKELQEKLPQALLIYETVSKTKNVDCKV
ncbi:MAG: M48 family metallopeptidase [Leptospiraceae bacterium]|nr:M48 family metallopeptidase [Leptospiraceae bacterium]MDW7977099.1 M48 family metallopeptidase [Leptospiraceae bacterium]